MMGWYQCGAGVVPVWCWGDASIMMGWYQCGASVVLG